MAGISQRGSSEVDSVQCHSLNASSLIDACSGPWRAPRVLRGALQNVDWPALRWGAGENRGLSTLREEHGHRKVNVRFARREKSGRTLWEGECLQLEVLFDDFCAWLANDSQLLGSATALKDFSKDEWCGYCAYQHFEEIFADLPGANFGAADFSQLIGKHFNTSFGSGPTLWLGSAGARTPCHQDAYGSNVVAQLAGEKRWILFPPTSAAAVKPQRLPYEDASTFTEFDPLSCELPPGSGGLIAVLGPGDVLLVPHHWWHAVECCSPWSLSVNQWLESPKDNAEKVSEALVRCLVSPFLCLPDGDASESEGKSWWLNPGEELYDTEDNLDFLSKSLEGLGGVQNDITLPRVAIRESLIRAATHPDVIAVISKRFQTDIAMHARNHPHPPCNSSKGELQSRSRSRSRSRSSLGIG